MTKIWPILVFCLLTISCKSNVRANTNGLTDSEFTSSIHQSQLQKSYNADSTLLLAKEMVKLSSKNPFPSIRFIVMDVDKNDTIYVGLEKNADVEWYNTNHVKVTRKPETITVDQKPEDYIFILNPFTKKVYRLKDYQHKQDSNEL